MDGASNITLENEFGTSNEDECIVKILEKGSVQTSEVSWVSIYLGRRRGVSANLAQCRTLSVAAIKTTPWEGDRSIGQDPNKT
jgi:Shwachman-Bodian-Diamond syndrome (SBDS) protein